MRRCARAEGQRCGPAGNRMGRGLDSGTDPGDEPGFRADRSMGDRGAAGLSPRLRHGHRLLLLARAHGAESGGPGREGREAHPAAVPDGAPAAAGAAAAAGASVTHVDASKGMVNWAKENAISSGLADAKIRWLVDDCKKFVEREIRRGNRYDGIIMDPPSYGRGPKGELWKIEDAIYPLIMECSEILSDNPLFFLVNSYTTGLQPAVLSYMISSALSKFDGTVESSEIGLPVTLSGLVLPCGASGRFIASSFVSKQ